MLKLLQQIVRVGLPTEPLPADAGTLEAAASDIHDEILAVLGRALAIREVDAGSCNGCELEIHALNNPYYNLEGRGIRFVASPRHADLLLVTGPVARNMALALRRTYDATPAPKLVVAVGDCGCSGGIFGAGYAVRGAVADVIPVDVAVRGCPPPPLAILRGILVAVRRLRAGAAPPPHAAPTPAGTAGQRPPT
ncbi:MAG: formate hydrogenlyase [Rubrivivax sp.]